MPALQPHEIRHITLTAITAVASDDLLSQRLVLKGGNALQLVYEIGARASVDLDFSVGGDIEVEVLRNRLGAALTDRFDREGYVVFDYKCEPRPRVITTAAWGGYTAEFKLIRRDAISELEASELRRLGRRAAQSARAKLPADAPRGQRREIVSPEAVRSASPSKLSVTQRLELWRRNYPQPHVIDVSKYEYVEGYERKLVQDFDCAVYTPAMIGAEKLRALCQQLPGYSQRRNPAPRARDFYDIHALATSEFRVDVAANLDLVRAMFAAKDVPLSLLGSLPESREFHRTNWETVVQAISGGVPHGFDFYFDFVIGEVGRLQALWKV